ncbi:YicC family protein [Corticibacter populi]|uniref:YicC family protein n=2 Tax=Corticibacter populi TaxID=1550736 RepID=A0A3M6QZB2_9BURK|nr:YicC/YloC family endoribonuclease [Corticibacter populi]RMX08308.1 YicC family protein [Corticibacter populi]
MTGFASVQLAASARPGQAGLGLELRSVNSRFLDLAFRLPEALRTHEPRLRRLLTDRLQRGKVELRGFLLQEQTQAVAVPDAALLQQLSHVQEQVLAWLPQARPFSVAEVLQLPRGHGEESAELSWDDALENLAQTLVQDLLTARRKEGERLVRLLQDKVSQLRALAEQARPLVPQLVEQQRQRFLERWQDALAQAGHAGASSDGIQERAIAEATAYALRIDIAEELGRLASHLDEIESLFKKGGAIGKRLDFLMQELHREANTLGSKSATLELSRISMDMKVLVEQMREQVQNIE